jgi:hypothetical protein
VGERERDSLAVGRPVGPVEADQDQPRRDQPIKSAATTRIAAVIRFTGAWLGDPSTRRSVPAESADERAPADRTDPNEPAEPTENADPAEPIEPIENAEPTDPIDRKEPFDATDSIESSDHNDHIESATRR